MGVLARSRSSAEADAQRYYRLGQTQFEQGKTLQAIESLKKAIEMDPKLAEAQNYLGIVYLQQSDPSRAAKCLKKAVDINPYYTDAHNTLGVAYKELGKYDRARSEFETALKDKTYPTPEKIHLNMGHLYLTQGKYPEAIRSFEQALTIKPSYLRGILGLGLAYQKSGRAELATRKFQDVVRLGPESPEAAEARQLLIGQGKRDGS
jgi:Tfp pilus assembly protein PilF